ncbi:MAG: iron-sulfur cluster assembly scaffold protein [Thermodesulfobacteriota bacterium]|nr:iron-sulfur cluster assembly scaffold protein [Thermodesulfobacteriota bacterium]
MYTEKVMDHFKNPRNIGIIEEPTAIIQVGDPDCGDTLLLSLKIKKDKIVDVKYKIYGCAAAIATSSIASEMMMGKTLNEALKITEDSITEALGGLPGEKHHCSNLAASALRGAINEYRKSALKRA